MAGDAAKKVLAQNQQILFKYRWILVAINVRLPSRTHHTAPRTNLVCKQAMHLT